MTTLESFETFANQLSTLPPPPSEPGRALSAHAQLDLIWRGLRRGTFRVVSWETEPESAALTFELNDHPPPSSEVRVPASQVLDAVLRGQSQKVVAMDFAVAPSTVACKLNEAMSRMGLPMRATRAPLALLLLAQAVHFPQGVSSVFDGGLPARSQERCGIRFARTDVNVRERLSHCEFAVAQLLLEGKSYGEMSALRGVSLRTIANQIVSIGRKLSVRGRFDLLRASIERNLTTIPVPAGDIVSEGLTRIA